MKNIKYIAILVLQCALVQFTFAQSTNDNGRPTDATPGSVVKTEKGSVAKDIPNTGSYIVDLDTPGAQKVEGEEITKKDISFPIDLELMKDEIMANNPAEVNQRVDELTALVDDLRRITDELRLENKVIRESFSNCCSSDELRLSASDAYLLQNAPNPFNESAEISYFVPQNMENVELHIRDIKGAILSTIKINEAGFGKVLVDSATLSNGTFVYTLSVNREIIDSKVMIVTK